MKKSIHIVLAVVLIFAILPSLASCKKESKAQKPRSSAEEKPQAPSSLKSIKENLDKIIAELESKKKMTSDSSLAQDSQLVSKEKTGKSKKGGEGAESSAKGIQNWQNEIKILKALHQNWNSLEPDALEAGLGLSSRNNFEEELDQLSEAIGQEKVKESFSSTINLYNNYADIVAVFANRLPAEFFRVNYESMSAIFYGEENDWQMAINHARKLEECWETLKMQAKDADKKLINRIEFAVQDLLKTIENQQTDLLLIKGEILMKNLAKLEEEF